MSTVFDDFPIPPASKLLGWKIEALDPAAGTATVSFLADERFLNPGGTVQGGFLAAMLDDTQGPALLAATHGDVYAPTIDFHVTFLKPARPGRFVGKARVVNVGKTIAVTDAELFDSEDQLIARGTFIGRVMRGGIPRSPQT
jgi:uncharacterized protein (TIGR00369 family)